MANYNLFVICDRHFNLKNKTFFKYVIKGGATATSLSLVAGYHLFRGPTFHLRLTLVMVYATQRPSTIISLSSSETSAYVLVWLASFTGNISQGRQ